MIIVNIYDINHKTIEINEVILHKFLKQLIIKIWIKTNNLLSKIIVLNALI